MQIVLNITFLFPEFLWALTLIGIPIIIHLFNFRRFKTVFFPNVALLQTIKNKSKRHKNLRERLILLFRILTIACLVLAFSFPYETEDKQSFEGEVISIYIDNSLSMDADGIEGHKLKTAKIFTDVILSQVPPNAKIHLVTNDFSPEHNLLFSPKVAQEKASFIQPSSKFQTLQQILNFQTNFLHDYKAYNKQIIWVSDFEQTSPSKLINPDSIPIYCNWIRSKKTENISIDSVTFEHGKRKTIGQENIQILITNHSEQLIKDFPVSLKVNNSIYKKAIDLDPQKKTSTSLSYQIPNDSLIKGLIKINDNNFKHDNNYYFGYKLPRKRRVLLITEEEHIEKTVKKLFKNDSLIILTKTSSKNINFGKVCTYDLIILGELQQLPNGLIPELQQCETTTTFIIPPNQKLHNSYSFAYKAGTSQDTTEKEIAWIDKQHALFKNVFEKRQENAKEEFPSTYKNHYILNKNYTSLIKYETNESYLSTNGSIFVLAASISEQTSNLKNNALIVPLFYQLLFNSSPITPVQYSLPTKEILANKTSEDQLEISRTPTEKGMLCEVKNNKVLLTKPLVEAGFYYLKSGNFINAVLGLNINGKESIVNENLEELIQAKVKDDEINFSEINLDNINLNDIIETNDKEYWRFCLLSALFFIICELVVSKLNLKM